jgi:hypothetical protein
MILLYLSFGLSLALCSFDGIYAVVQISQYIQLLLFFNVPFPHNFLQFSKSFSKSLLSQIPNPYKGAAVFPCALPKQFNERQIDCLLFENYGLILTLLAVFTVFSFLVSIAMKNYNKKMENLENYLKD